MKRRLMGALLLLWTAAFANGINPLNVRSDQCDIADGFFRLSGNVRVEDDTHSAQAQMALLFASDNRVDLMDKVSLLRMDGEEISCERASLFLSQDKATFSGSVQLKFEPAGAFVRSDDMEISWKEGQIESCGAKGSVHIQFESTGFASGGSAHFMRLADLSHIYPEHKFPGVLTLTAEPMPFCHVQMDTGDVLFAKELRLSIPVQTLHGDEVHGTVRDSVKNTTMHYRARRCFWDQNENIITLSENVSLEDAVFGRLHSVKDVEIYRDPLTGDTQKVVCRGTSTLVLEDGRRVRCYKSIFLDVDKGEISFESPARIGRTYPRKQVVYTDQSIRIAADRMQLKYGQDKDGLQVQHITLEGSVQMEQDTPGIDPVHQYALADRVEIFPKEKRVSLYAVENSSVIFYDEIQEMQISAPAVHGVRGKDSDTRGIWRGEGNVRMSLAEEEVEALKARFERIR